MKDPGRVGPRDGRSWWLQKKDEEMNVLREGEEAQVREALKSAQ